MAKYNVIARRNSNCDWSNWTNTNSKQVAKYAVKVIESYGYQWTLEKPISHAAFLTVCYAKGIDWRRAKEFAKDRFHFTSHDINYLLEEKKRG